MPRSPVLVVVIAVAASSVGTTAHAGVLKLYAEAQGGAMLGKGTGGDLVNNDTDNYDEAFFENAGPLAYGIQLGAQVLFLEGHVRHQQFRGFSDDADKPDLATWTQLGVGMRFEGDIGSQTAGEKKSGKGTYFELGWDLGFGVGTGQQIAPPLSNDEVSDKGFFVEARVGFGKHLNTIFDVGFAVPVQYGYYFKSDDGAVANDLSTHYQSAQIEALLYLRANIRLL